MEVELVAAKLSIVLWPLSWALSLGSGCGSNGGWLTMTINISKITHSAWDSPLISLTWGWTAAFKTTSSVGVDAGLSAIGIVALITSAERAVKSLPL